jgi:hypothetical protein
MEGVQFLFLMLGVAAVLTLLACIDQRKLWYCTRGWTYADPAANEPSEAYFAFTRVGLVILVLGSIAIVTWVWSATPEDNGPAPGADYDASAWEHDTPDEDNTPNQDDTRDQYNTPARHGTALDLRDSERF